MIWVWAGIAWLGAAFLLALILGEMWGPKSEYERLMNDQAQIEALRENNRQAHATLDALDKLKAKIPGGEA